MIQRRKPLLRYSDPNRNKFHAIAVHDTDTGESWDSKGEHHRWGMLKLLEQSGHLTNLVGHPKVILIEKNGKAPEIAWRADSSYTEDGRTVFEDFKPRPTTPRENLIFKLWVHFGPGLLRIVGKNGKTLKTIMGKG